MEENKIIDYVVISENRDTVKSAFSINNNLKLIAEYKSKLNTENSILEVCKYALNIINKISSLDNNDISKNNLNVLSDEEKSRLEYLFSYLANNFNDKYKYKINVIKLMNGYFTDEKNEKLHENHKAIQLYINITSEKIDELNSSIEKLEEKIELFKVINPNQSQFQDAFVLKLNEYSKRGYVLQGGYFVNDGYGYQAMVKYEK